MYGLKNVRNRRHDALAQVQWQRFETILAEHYAGQGWAVEHAGTGAGGRGFDGGVDLKLRRQGQYVLVQCKHWNAKQVTHNAVHELLGIKVNENATGAIVITSGEFTQAAQRAATRQNHVELIDGDALRLMLGPQLDALAATKPPALPGGPRRRSNPRTFSRQTRAGVLAVSVLLAAIVLYGAYRLLMAPILTYPIDIELPQRVIPTSKPSSSRDIAPPPPSPQRDSTEAPTVEQGTTGEALEEWKRKNAESMRILEENERREAEAQLRVPTG